ncbi:N-acetylmuramic acid 6-phosphate etherase [Chamaesiphon polymorphus CCALA 037]|uniref:N-acetylmuramic acid 6-phosphate etherase n=2 Tax=Chamaesiphon TaxID=217161 RepID=A0A2T1G3I4_9CYAN|nr:N-acetylmuramic acid 6-phosphate etherase [Chamaesiphon polymorphus CCALA 037]
MTTRGHLLTEQVNVNSANLDRLSTPELVDLFNQEDVNTLNAIAGARVELASAIDTIADSLRQGGRLFYIGAGTSGRLGVLDAAECPPTFCTPPELVQGILAGGAGALVKSSEGLEDIASDGAQAMADNQIGQHDVVVGITAGGTTPYVHGAIEAAKQRGAKTVFIACVPANQVASIADIDIRLPVGPEILSGSTRLKSGTVTKMALNILSTGTMVKLGKVYGNRMVDVAVTNTKLLDRALQMIQDLTQLEREDAKELLEASGRSVKAALLMHWTQVDRAKAEAILSQNHGQLRSAVESTKNG